MAQYDKPESTKKNPAWVSILGPLTWLMFYSPVVLLFVGGWLLALNFWEWPSPGVVVMSILTYVVCWVLNMALRAKIEDDYTTIFEPANTLIKF